MERFVGINDEFYFDHLYNDHGGGGGGGRVVEVGHEGKGEVPFEIVEGGGGGRDATCRVTVVALTRGGG